MNNQVEKWVNEWAIASGDHSFRDINAQLNFFASELFHDYQPTQSLASNFKSRLENWLSNLTNDEDRKTLFKILPHIFYVGSKEFNNLFRVAYNEIIAKWLIDVNNIRFDNIQVAKTQIDDSLKQCWICPITDSFNVNSFFKINNIPSNGWNEWRPQWYTIDRGNDLWKTYHKYIVTHGIRKLILLEDFIGSGSQVEGVVDFVLDKGLDLDVLLVPLINCPTGHQRFSDLEIKYDRLTYQAVLKPSSNCFVTQLKTDEEPIDFDQFRDLITRSYLQVSNGLKPGFEKPYSPYGYRETGGLIVMFSNTPDNTIPSIHWNSDTWNPIFPRHSRN
ncbi:hypothetical protein C9994_03370 [Marivirga lumbricoides]|uniref:PRTase-CE domain-containing protein n=1 Tax=Marivirga lumbricoides TaxID=1046115 RepID=A0A2T4DU37_9BACT|nr:hypothetical protein C9994_03370 [Marivirga lumbricoides]